MATVAVLAVWAAGVSCGSANEAAPKPTTEVVISDLTPGATGKAAAGANVVLAYAGTDHTTSRDKTRAAVSIDGGRSFRTVDIAADLYEPAALVTDDGVVLVGTSCERGDPSQPCAGDASPLEAVRIDSRSASAEPLPPIPATGLVVGPVDGGPQPEFMVETAHGRQLLRFDDGDWELLPLPEGTFGVCQSGGQLTAIVPADQQQPDFEPVGAGRALYSAVASTDEGSSWGQPVAFVAAADRDLAFQVGVSCGANAVLALTTQLAVFDVAAGTWSPVGDAAEPMVFNPASAVTWLDGSSLIVWSEPAMDGSTVAYDAAHVTGIDSGHPVAALAPAQSVFGSSPTTVTGTATAPGLYLDVSTAAVLRTVH
ncbi:hypothetical protein [Dermatobacter hominis]|uniref:hypothetical protein n=1 Tax=Dermatobacter hominis TaxID=2884263 RepID=UPI001D10E503|nr:hypothetical protein [Dermatobacter hominis]UDY34022.1 hypothetical protein LH044_11770 [Dermatobacter hominis]